MKRFDLRQIMRDAHRTYKYVGKKQGKTFGEVLKSTWKLAKLNVTMQEELARQQEERNNKVFRKRFQRGSGMSLEVRLRKRKKSFRKNPWIWLTRPVSPGKMRFRKKS